MTKIAVYVTAACGPSQQIKKALKKVVAEDELEVEFVIIEADPARVREQGILATPTIQVLDNNGKVIKTLVGYNPNTIKMIKEGGWLSIRVNT